MINVADILILDMNADKVILWVFDPGSVVVIHLGDLGFINQLNRVSERRTDRFLIRPFAWRSWLSISFEALSNWSLRLNVQVLLLWKWLLHNQSTPLNLAILTIIREEIKILEAFLPPQLGNLTQEHLLLGH
jgi:hypothetical protein